MSEEPNGWKFRSDSSGTHFEEATRTDAEITELEAKEIRQRLNLVEAEHVVSSMPSTPVEFARWFLSDDD